jgi:hypothetical protein
LANIAGVQVEIRNRFSLNRPTNSEYCTGTTWPIVTRDQKRSEEKRQNKNRKELKKRTKEQNRTEFIDIPLLLYSTRIKYMSYAQYISV